MSRSRKKTPGFTDGSGKSSGKRFYKNYSNRIARKMLELPDGSAYKKQRFRQYQICDFKFLYYNKEQLNYHIEYYKRRGWDIQWHMKWYHYWMK